jgi:hypothetical protein
MRRIGAIVLFLASPAMAQGMLEQAPAGTLALNGDYRQIAECAFERIDRVAGTGVKKTDLPGMKKARISLESGGVRYWEIVVSASGAQSATVEMSVVRTMWGPSTKYADQLLPEVAACEISR